jgi:membrane associated rhomboid family serine protease
MAAGDLQRTWRRIVRTVAPSATNVIISVTLLVFLLQLLPGIGDAVTRGLLYAPIYSTQIALEPWRLVTVALVHSTSIFHIAFNMIALWMFGQQLEGMLGKGRFVALYVLSAMGGSVAVLFIPFLTNGPVVGASGAIFGLLGAFFVIVRKLGANATGLLVIIGLNLAVGFFFGSISWQSHVGGLLVGALVGLVFTRTRNRRQFRLQVGSLIAIGAVLLALGTLPALMGIR